MANIGNLPTTPIAQMGGQLGVKVAQDIFVPKPLSLVTLENTPTYESPTSPLGSGTNYDPYGGLNPNIYGYGD